MSTYYAPSRAPDNEGKAISQRESKDLNRMDSHKCAAEFLQSCHSEKKIGLFCVHFYISIHTFVPFGSTALIFYF